MYKTPVMRHNGARERTPKHEIAAGAAWQAKTFQPSLRTRWRCGVERLVALAWHCGGVAVASRCTDRLGCYASPRASFAASARPVGTRAQHLTVSKSSVLPTTMLAYGLCCFSCAHRAQTRGPIRRLASESRHKQPHQAVGKLEHVQSAKRKRRQRRPRVRRMRAPR